jgi:hypothetical protein
MAGDIRGADQYLRRTINTPFFSLTMNIRDATRTEVIPRQGEDAIVGSGGFGADVVLRCRLN